MKTALITGGAGFIGSHLCKKLLEKKCTVICVDNLFVGSKENIAEFFSNPNFIFIKHNIIEPLQIDEPIHYLYNLACPASPIHYQYDPIFTIETNIIGTKNMLDLACMKGARMLQASTSEVYGDPLVHPQTEGYWGNVNPIGVRSCYDEGKRAAETLCFDFHRERGLDIRIVRIFNTYGPKMAVGDGRVVSNFIVQALRGEDLTLYGDGSQTRSFQYIDDLIRGMTFAMEKENFVGPVNLGNPNEFTVKELAEKVVQMTGSDSEMVYCPLPSDDPKQRQPDIHFAKQELGWTPEISLEEGLKKTILYFKQKLSKKNKVVVFTPSYFPTEGLQEKFVRNIAKKLPEIEFDIFTPATEKKDIGKEVKGNVAVYRLGGWRWFFPFRAASWAHRLGKKCNYVAIWAVMGKLGALSGIVLKWMNRRYPLFLSLDSNEIQFRWNVKDIIASCIRRVARRRASYFEIFDANGEISLDSLFEKSDTGKANYLAVRFRQLFYRLSLEKEFGRSFVTLKKIFTK